MKLSQCKLGVLVTFGDGTLVGMVVGISENRNKDAVPLVKWQNEEEPILNHHELLELYED